MANISPGVYTKIIDLSTYVQQVPSTIGFIAALTEKGEDNQLKFLSSRADLISEFGEPSIARFGKNVGQGNYEAYNFLGESGSLFFIRALPDNAQYANLLISIFPDSTAQVQLSYVNDVTSHAGIKTALVQAGDEYPLCMLYPIGRGEYYNKISVRLTEHANPLMEGVFVLDIYEKQSTGNDIIIESFEVSFNPTALDLGGDSLFITNVLDTYSSVLRADMELVSGDYAPGFDISTRIYDVSIGTVSVDLAGTISDNKQNFIDWQTSPESGDANYVVIATDAKGYKVWGWLGESNSLGDEINVFNGKDLDSASPGWLGDVANFDVSDASEITYLIKKNNIDVTVPFLPSEPVPLRMGTDGNLLTATGQVDQTVAKDLLVSAYSGLLMNPKKGILADDMYDTENIYFNVVFDAGYPTDVKTAISSLVQNRRDCVAILDNGDNATYAQAMDARLNNHVFNNKFCALYEEFNKVNDIFTGQDIWVSPVYHMAYILPRNDRVSELWFAAAGFNRAAIDTIKELRFNPKLAQRDQMYLKQLNPIVKFNEGYVVWGQLTSQARPSALQDLNIVRLVLYIQRALERYCRFFIFEQNDQITWGRVASDIIEFLEVIKKKRGLYSYSVDVGATDYMKKMKTFYVNVVLTPTRVVEKVELNFFIK